MNIDKQSLRKLCTDPVFKRAKNYRHEGRVQRIEQCNDIITAVVQGSSRYDVTVKRGDNTLVARCTCPFDGAGECKHVVAVLLIVADEPPRDVGPHVQSVLHDVSADELRAFLDDILAEHPDLRDKFLARFGDMGKSVEEYRTEVDQLFDQHTQNYPVVTDSIDFSHVFDVAEEYDRRERYLDAAAVYRALFEGVADNEERIDAAHDHYAKIIQSALNGYVDCVLAADPGGDELEKYLGVLEEQAMSGYSATSEQFYRAIDDLEDRPS